MSETGLTSTDMLLSNLADHQVIRIEGSQEWMNRIADHIALSNKEHLVLNGELILSSVQEQLAEYLNVDDDASFIQQELKGWLVEGKRLLIIVDSHSVGANALTYLMGLPSICDENGPAVTLILLTTPELLKALKSSPALAAKLDGYYQEESESKPIATASDSKTKGVAVAAAVACIGAGVWYFLQPSSTPNTVAEQTATPSPFVQSPQQQPAQPSLPVLEKAETADKSEKAETKAAQQIKPVEVISAKQEEQTVDSQQIAGNTTKAEEKDASPVQQVLLAELSEAVQSAKAGLNPTVESAENAAIKATNEIAEASGVAENTTAPVTAEKTVTVAPAETVKAQAKTTEEQVVAAQPVKPQVTVDAEQKDVAKTQSQSNSNAVVSSERNQKPVVTKKYATAAAIAAINNEDSVREVVAQWGKAWGSQDWDGYIDSYLQNTKLYGVKMSLEEWRAFRKKRLLSPKWIKLELGDATFTRLNTHWYRAEFYQRFEKPGYADETTKRLELTLTANGWKIASEATEGTVVLKRP